MSITICKKCLEVGLVTCQHAPIELGSDDMDWEVFLTNVKKLPVRGNHADDSHIFQYLDLVIKYGGMDRIRIEGLRYMDVIMGMAEEMDYPTIDDVVEYLTTGT